MKTPRWILLALCVLIACTGCTSAPAPQRTATPEPEIQPTALPAFPGAEGFGAASLGGRGGAVLEVTNLDDDGPGSLRAAVKAEGARTVVFRVAGTIELKSSLKITHPFITIAGQSAPGAGITLRGVTPEVEALILIETHDVIIRFLSFRAGPPSAGDGLAIIASDAHDTYNIVIDHNSLSWAVNRNLMTWYDVHDISIQWNILSEALDCSIHQKGCHSKGALLGGYASDENKDKPGAANISFHHNLLAHNGERNPMVSTSGVTDVVNNVVYNPFGSFSHVDMQQQSTSIPVNYVGNFFKPGPDTDRDKYGVNVVDVGDFGASIFVQGNLGPQRANEDQPEINVVDPDARAYVVDVRNPAALVTTTSALKAYEQVLTNAGAALGLSCDGSFFWRRDAIDARIVTEVQAGTGQVIDDPSEVGGWLTIPPATPCADSDHDGMPDQWESLHGLNSDDASDASSDHDSDGYTALEEFLNGTDPNS